MRNIQINAETEKVKNNVDNLRWAQPTLQYLLIMSSILTLLMVTACGGGGGDNGPTSPSTTLSFSGINPGSNAVYMTKNSSLSSGDTLAIDVKANGISGNVKGAAFDVDFDSTKITYSSYAEGNFFGSGSSTIAALQQGSSSKVVVGVSTASGTVTGSGTIVTLKFKVTGSSSVAFSNYELRDSSNQSISGITWSGGTVTVQ